MAMTVAKLIQILQGLPPEAPVFVDHNSEVRLMQDDEVRLSADDEFTTDEGEEFSGPCCHITTVD